MGDDASAPTSGMEGLAIHETTTRTRIDCPGRDQGMASLPDEVLDNKNDKATITEPLLARTRQAERDTPRPHSRIVMVALEESVHSCTALEWVAEHVIQPGDHVHLVTALSPTPDPSFTLGAPMGMAPIPPGLPPALYAEARANWEREELQRIDDARGMLRGFAHTLLFTEDTAPDQHLPEVHLQEPHRQPPPNRASWTEALEDMPPEQEAQQGDTGGEEGGNGHTPPASLHARIKRHPAGTVMATCHVLADSTSAGPALVSYVHQIHADLVCVGSRGMGSIKRSFMGLIGLGSVSDYLVHHLEVPVMVVKTGTESTAAADQPAATVTVDTSHTPVPPRSAAEASAPLEETAASHAHTA